MRGEEYSYYDDDGPMIRALWNRVATLFTPDEVLLRPSVDFDESSGNFKIAIKGDLDGKWVRLGRRSITRGRGTFQGRRFRVNPYDFKVINDIIGSCEWADDCSLWCKKDNVPSCLSALRIKFGLERSPAASTVKIHSNPLENRTYLELDDPETLIVRQTLATSDDSLIQPPQSSSEELPGWLRVFNKFFQNAKRTNAKTKAGE